jgi:predicted 2-oxoglutarate/Fe(II)-dependent dioxygenase YbiX
MSPADLIRVLDCLELEMSPSAILETPDRDGLRADVGVLVCLYGECTVELDAGYGPLSIQMAASDVLICPSSVPLSVLSGDLAWLARFWAQSHVRSPAIREVLHDLATASAFADILGGEDHEGKQALRACYHDVLAMYAET